MHRCNSPQATHMSLLGAQPDLTPANVQVMLWPEEMADATLLVLSGQDDLVPSEMVQRHLRQTKSPCKVRHQPACLSACMCRSSLEP